MTFKEYLQSKKIDPKAFFQGQSATFNAWKEIFDQVSPESFTAQKLYLINEIRRTYPFVEPATKTSEPAKAAPKVKIPGRAPAPKITKK